MGNDPAQERMTYEEVAAALCVSMAWVMRTADELDPEDSHRSKVGGTTIMDAWLSDALVDEARRRMGPVPGASDHGDAAMLKVALRNIKRDALAMGKRHASEIARLKEENARLSAALTRARGEADALAARVSELEAALRRAELEASPWLEPDDDGGEPAEPGGDAAPGFDLAAELDNIRAVARLGRRP